MIEEYKTKNINYTKTLELKDVLTNLQIDYYLLLE